MEYINRCTLTVNGQDISDFKSVTEDERELARRVNLMHKTGHCSVTPRPGCKLDYAVPLDSPEFDFAGVKDGTLSIEYENGKRITYSGVRTLKVGESKIDGDNELVRTIEFGAEKRVEE
jgi:hypothetical protein